jgi:hypothetical protein
MGGLMAPRYECWGDDHEDLTKQVMDSWKSDPFFGYTSSEDPDEWTVIVTCSAGHENAFSGTGRP